ncbi:hypothetical protein C1H46_003727 [Malus baccata]|uniref:Uncharacterized protein n=1 Tax=Malus baccata TaxID=106549 RepID=A0A540NHW1_MALBA|nr:hypothetical protein C1H46_003727 [Malus baccata]
MKKETGGSSKDGTGHVGWPAVGGTEELVIAGLKLKEKVSGYHADNIAPAIIGGFVLIRSYEPLDLISLIFPDGKELFFMLATPKFKALTKKMSAALSAAVGMAHHVWNSSQAGAFVVAVLQGPRLLLVEWWRRRRQVAAALILSTLLFMIAFVIPQSSLLCFRS